MDKRQFCGNYSIINYKYPLIFISILQIVSIEMVYCKIETNFKQVFLIYKFKEIILYISQIIEIMFIIYLFIF